MSTLNIPSTTMTLGSATGNPNNKVALKKGRGLMDWVRLGHTNKDLAGTGGKIIKVTPEQLSHHNKRDDAWIALNGKVYNITPYFEYHPGGEDQLMRGVGIDATNLFNEVHKWVNFESLLQKCLIGPLVQSRSIFSKFKFLPILTDKSNATMKPPEGSLSISTVPKINYNGPPPSAKGGLIFTPKYDWFQTDSTVNIAIYTNWTQISHRHIIIVCIEQMLKIYVYIKEYIFIVNVELHRNIEKGVVVRVASAAGKVDVIFRKLEQNIRWSSLGNPLSSDNKITAIRDATIDYYSFKIISKSRVTHDTYLFELETEDIFHFGVPIGFHVFLGVPNIDIRRPYTPISYPIGENGGESYKSIKLFIKIYQDGILTSRISSLCESDSLEVGIPQGSFAILQQQQISKLGNLLLLAAGTGITPFPALIFWCLENNIPIKLINFNKTEDDIAWSEDFDKLEKSAAFSVMNVLSRPHEDWSGAKGCVTKELLQGEIHSANEFVCISGPRQFNDLCVKLLEEVGVSENNMFSFVG